MSVASTLDQSSHRISTTSQAAKPHASREGLWLAIVSFFVYAGAAVYLVYGMHYMASDAMSRVANAYYVLFSRDPHLGAIGFVWNPLPSVLELPLVALRPLFPAVVIRGLAGSAVSAALGAIAVYHLYHILSKTIVVPRTIRLVIISAFALNPMVVLYSANGMSDMMWIACILGTYSGLLDFLQDGQLRRLISAGLWLAAGFGMRYEAIPFGFMLILAIAVAMWGRESASKWHGAAIIFGAPVVFASGVWIYFNWLIMKNPLYFLNSSYGNLAQTSTGAYMTPAIAAADHHLLGSLIYVLRFGELYWPIYIGMAFALWFCFGKRRDPRAIVLVFGTIGTELLEFALLYKGSLGEWDRYFMEFIPNGILLMAFLIFKTRSMWALRRSLWKFAMLAFMGIIVISGSVGTVVALQQTSLGNPDGQAIDAAYHRQSQKGTINNPFSGGALNVVSYANQHPHMTILADTFIDWPVVIRARHLNQFTITSDYQFNSILYNPRGRVTAFLVPRPYQVAQLDAINRAWPGLWAGHVPWVKLIKQFPGTIQFRLYKILPSAP